MTIDINKLRRLAQAATPGPWINHGRQPNATGIPHSAVAAKTLLARVYSEAYGDVAQETANASIIAAANPSAILELLDRLEAAEQVAQDYLRIDGEKAQIAQKLATAEKAVSTAYQRGYATGQEEIHAELDVLRAKVEAMESDFRLIAETDPIDAALDPQRAIRIAWHTLKRIEE